LRAGQTCANEEILPEVTKEERMRDLLTLGLLLIASFGLTADPSSWTLDLQTRAVRRADPSGNAARHAAWTAKGRPDRPIDENVVDGSFDPTILAPIELIDQVIPVFNLQRPKQERFRREWSARGATQLLGRDFWSRLEEILGPAIAVDHENRRLGQLPAAEREAVTRARPHQQHSDAVECATRASVLAAARATWGESFDRFLYEAVAPGVYFSSSCSDPQLMAKPEFWLAEWRSMEEGCR
jgi:hypothetical protein